MKVVKLLKPYGKWSAGDIAGFDDEKADAMIEAKVAAEHVADNGKSAKAGKPGGDNPPAGQ